MKITRRVIVIDAADIDTESRFWGGLLSGTVHRDDARHSIVVGDEWVMGVQHAPDHVPPDWRSGPQQQMHLDLHVDDLDAAHALATELGGRRLQAPRRAADNPHGEEFFAVYASTAGTPSASECISGCRPSGKCQSCWLDPGLLCPVARRR